MFPSRRGTSRRAWLAAILAAATVAVFGPAVRHEFLPYDDHVYVTENPRVLGGPTPASLRWSLTATDGGSWHPVTWWSHLLDVHWYGSWAGGHHLTSVLIHAATGVVLFLALARSTGATGPSWVAAFLFSLHPLHVESVAWVAERKDVLAGFFFTAALAAYLAHARRPGGWRLPLAVALYCLGLMAKPIVVLLPVACLLLDYWPLGRLRAATVRQAAGLLREKAAMFGLAAAAGVLALRTQAGAYAFEDIGVVAAPFRAVMLATNLANAVGTYLVYLGQAAWPAGLAVFYPYPPHAPAWWRTAAALAALVALSVAAVRLRRRAPYAAMGWAWYLVLLLPLIGFLQVGSQAHADRYTYLSLTGVFIAAAWGGRDLLRRAPRLRPAILPAAACAIAAVPLLSSRQLAHWRDGASLFGHALEATPDNYLAHQILGDVLRRRGDAAGAEAHYRRVLALRPRYPGARNSLGLALSGQGRLEEALAQYRMAARQDPSDPQPLSNLGVDLTALGRPVEAEEPLRRALALAPAVAEIHSNLGDALALQGRLPEAADAYRRALGLKPDLPQARERLGRIAGRAEAR